MHFSYNFVKSTQVIVYKTLIIAIKHEHHPNQQGNGRMTVDFFKEEFNFSGRETVAIMGAHTFGRFHAWKSLYPYVWTSYGESLINNDYYKYELALL